jgi:hypothetical protein
LARLHEELHHRLLEKLYRNLGPLWQGSGSSSKTGSSWSPAKWSKIQWLQEAAPGALPASTGDVELENVAPRGSSHPQTPLSPRGKQMEVSRHSQRRRSPRRPAPLRGRPRRRELAAEGPRCSRGPQGDRWWWGASRRPTVWRRAAAKGARGRGGARDGWQRGEGCRG